MLALLALALLTGAALGGRLVAAPLTPPLPRTAERFAPPLVYARWWAAVEACSGRARPLGAVMFYEVPGATAVPAWGLGVAGWSWQRPWKPGWAAAYYSRARDRVVLAGAYADEGDVVRHEMLHALLRVPGHPRAAFLDRCGGVVLCDHECRAAAGLPPPPDPAAVPVEVAELQVRGVVEPAAPHRAVDGGRFTFTVLVTNPRATPVVVALRPSTDAGPPVSYSWDVRCLAALGPCPGVFEVLRDERADDQASATRFAAGETKRFAVDFRVAPRGDGSWAVGGWAIAPGRYAFTGYYGGRHAGGAASAPDTVLILE